jgi:hypothetical protein
VDNNPPLPAHCALARHEHQKCWRRFDAIDPQVRGEIDRLATGENTQAASRALVASLRQSPEALSYLAKKLPEAA